MVLKTRADRAGKAGRAGGAGRKARTAPAVPPPPERRRFRQRLLVWYGKHGRDLPWRTTDDPYHILVSEIMLQQTQVDRVLPKYAEWLESTPRSTCWPKPTRRR